jgi:hypothetical protein
MAPILGHAVYTCIYQLCLQVILLQNFKHVFFEIAFLKTATRILSTVLDRLSSYLIYIMQKISVSRRTEVFEVKTFLGAPHTFYSRTVN